MIHIIIKIQAFNNIKLFEPGVGAETVSISPLLQSQAQRHNLKTQYKNIF